MNKALHVFVYLFLILAAAGLFFEHQLTQKRQLLTDRNRLQEDYLVKLAGTIEVEEPNKDAVAEIKKDASPVEAKIVDTPTMENVLEEYKAYLEQDNLATFKWESQDIREKLRQIYVLDDQGQPMMDGDRYNMRGPEWELLEKLLAASQNQQGKLNTTRAELKILHEKLATVVDELNKLKPEARQDKVTIVEKDESIAKLETEKKAVEDNLVKVKSQIDELNAEIAGLKDEKATLKDEAEAAKDDLAKSQKLVDQLKKLLQEAVAASSQSGAKTAAGIAVSTVPSGEKGKLVEVHNVDMFAIVEFSQDAMKELKGPDLSRPLPVLEFGVKRKGFKGASGEFVGRIRLRQEVPGKNYVICDILSNWEQDKLKINDIVFAD